MWDTTRSNRNTYASNFLPLWCGIFPPGDARIDQVVEALSSSGLVMPGGIATSLMETGQQWYQFHHHCQSANIDSNLKKKNVYHAQGVKLVTFGL
jgi:hypothetical protein